MRLEYVPVRKYHVREDNHYALTEEWARKLNEIEYYLHPGSVQGFYRMCVCVRSRDVDDVVNALYGDMHRAYIDGEVTGPQSGWLKEHHPEVFVHVLRDDKGRFLYMPTKQDAVRFRLAT